MYQNLNIVYVLFGRHLSHEKERETERKTERRENVYFWFVIFFFSNAFFSISFLSIPLMDIYQGLIFFFKCLFFSLIFKYSFDGYLSRAVINLTVELSKAKLKSYEHGLNFTHKMHNHDSFFLKRGYEH